MEVKGNHNLDMNISILLPTRARTHALFKSVSSLLEHAQDPSTVQFLFAFDNDDEKSSQWCVENIIPRLQEAGCQYKVLSWPRMGYEKLNRYVNNLAKFADGNWLVFWNDDALMDYPGWDREIASVDEFCIQAFDTHNKHPYSIFPIVPREWYEWLGHLSKHQLSDAYISQIAWMMGIMKRTDIKVTHDRYDLTGNNNDDIYHNRPMLEGNPNDPADFNHPNFRNQRINDAQVLAGHLEERGYDMSHWKAVLAGDQDPWAEMLKSDVNNHMQRMS